MKKSCFFRNNKVENGTLSAWLAAFIGLQLCRGTARLSSIGTFHLSHATFAAAFLSVCLSHIRIAVLRIECLCPSSTYSTLPCRRVHFEVVGVKVALGRVLMRPSAEFPPSTRLDVESLCTSTVREGCGPSVVLRNVTLYNVLRMQLLGRVQTRPRSDFSFSLDASRCGLSVHIV